MLLSVQGDGTPLLMREWEYYRIGNHLVKREGGRPVELFLLRSFILCRDNMGCTQMVYNFRPSLPMKDKKAWDTFAAVNEWVPDLWMYRGDGITIHNNAWDRGPENKPMNKHLHEELLLSIRDLGLTEYQTERRIAQQWSCDRWCAQHDTQRCLIWSVTPYFTKQKRKFMKDIHVDIACLRDMYSPLMSAVPLFAQQKLTFDNEPFDAEKNYEYWHWLNTEDTVARQAADLNLRFHGNLLLVDHSWEGNPKLGEMVLSSVAGVLKLSDYTDSRWSTMRRSLGPWLAGNSLGLPGIVDIAKTVDPRCRWYLRGFGRTDAGHRSS